MSLSLSEGIGSVESWSRYWFDIERFELHGNMITGRHSEECPPAHKG